MSEPLSAEEAVARFGFYTGLTRGDSMEPMLRQGRDRVCIERRTGRLRRYEVPLYRRPSGQLVLHRIVQVLPEGYVTCGDNRRCRERGVTDAMIVGVLTGFYRGKRYVAADSLGYRLFSRCWVAMAPLLPLIKKIYHILRK